MWSQKPQCTIALSLNKEFSDMSTERMDNYDNVGNNVDSILAVKIAKGVILEGSIW